MFLGNLCEYGIAISYEKSLKVLKILKIKLKKAAWNYLVMLATKVIFLYF